MYNNKNISIFIFIQQSKMFIFKFVGKMPNDFRLELSEYLQQI